MKKIIISFCLLLAATTFAQKQYYYYSPFRFDLGGGISVPISGFGIGGLLSVEPKYQINKFALGVRIEYHTENQTKPDFSTTRSNKSILLTCDYYFNNRETFRPFVGAGFGVSAININSSNDDSGSYSSGSYYDDRLSGMLRFGVDMPHFRIALQGNILGTAKQTYHYYSYSSAFYGEVPDKIVNQDLNYLAIIAAFGIGGNRRVLP